MFLDLIVKQQDWGMAVKWNEGTKVAKADDGGVMSVFHRMDITYY